MYVPSVVEVDHSQRRLPSPVERLFSGEWKLYANFRLGRSSDEDYAPPAGGIHPEDRITQVSSPPPFVRPFLRSGAGSGFAPDSTTPSGRRAYVPVSKRHHECISHTKEQRGNTPPKDTPRSPPLLTTSQVVPSLAVIVRDTPMDLGGGSDTNGTGIGDSRYATGAQPRSATRSLSPCADPTFSSLPALPLTMSYRSPSQVDVALLSSLEDIRSGNAVPLSSSPASSHGSVTSSLDLDDASMIDGCRTYTFVGGKEAYSSCEEVAADIQHLSKQQNNCLNEIVSLKGEIKLLKAVIARLEGDTVAHEAELTIDRGVPVWSSWETIRGSVGAEAAKRMNGGVTHSPLLLLMLVQHFLRSVRRSPLRSRPIPSLLWWIGWIPVVARPVEGEGIGLPARLLFGPLLPFLLLFRYHHPRPGRRCIAELQLPLPLHLCRIQLGQVIRFGQDW